MAESLYQCRESKLFQDALICLKDSSLLQAFAQELDRFYHSSLHPLINDWIRLRTNESIGRENTCMAATLVREILVNSMQKMHFDLPLLAKQNITLHIIALEESYQEFFNSQPYLSNRSIFDEYTNSQSWLTRFLLNAGLYHLAEIINKRLNAQNEKILGLEHPSTLASMAELAVTFRNQGRWNEAEELNVQVMETRKRVLGIEHPDTLTSMASLASTYENQGQWKKAEELEVQVLETSSRVLDLEHPDTLTSMANLASTYWNQGRWKEAKELGVQVMETRKGLLGLEHPDTLGSINNLAFKLSSLDLKNEAIQLMSEVVQYRQEKIGSDNPHSIDSVRTLHYWRDQK